MPLWKKSDDTPTDKPKYLNATDKANTVGADAEETAANDGIAHSGWVLKTEGTGDRAGRVHYETLVAMRDFQGGLDQDQGDLAPWTGGSSSSSSAGV